jgi:FkbM family methyltransferase
MTNPLLSLAGWAASWLPMPVKRLFYRVKPLASLIRGSLNRAAPQGLAPVTVAAGGLEGARLYLDLHSEKDYWLGTYEPELQVAVRDFVLPGMVVYDVGANVGYISLLLARQVGEKGRVFAFEALPANLERLNANVELNGMADRIEVIPGAVVENAHAVRFWVGPSDDMGKAEGSAGRKDVAYSEVLDIDGLSLDDFVYGMGRPSPQVIKMDIEGGEVLALPGMQRLLREVKPLVLLELHGPEAARVAWEALTRAGYQVCRMQPGYPVVKSFDALDWKAYCVAVCQERVEA